MRKKLLALGMGFAIGLTMLLPAYSANILRDGAFEEDFICYRYQREASCGSEHNDHFFNKQDLFPDFWTYDKLWWGWATQALSTEEYPNTKICRDDKIKHAGKYSLKIQDAGNVSHTEVHYYQLYDPNVNGAYVAPEKKLASFSNRNGLFRELKISGFCRTENAPSSAVCRVRVVVAGHTEASINFSSGTHDWERVETIIPAKADVTPTNMTVYVEYNGVGGTAWFDDIVVDEQEPTEPNLLENAGFEKVTNEYPNGWGLQKKFTWMGYYTYYVWNNWWHFYSINRGTVSSSSAILHSGNRSLKFTVLPGDEMCVDGPEIKINQTEPSPIEVGMWVKADKAKRYDFKLIDENGNYLYENNFLTRGIDVPCGTYDWFYMRKHFQGDHPVKSIKLRIGARGFNGKVINDVGYTPEENQVSTIWVDDVKITEKGSTPDALKVRGVNVPSNENPPDAARPTDAVRLANVDFGERLFGKNIFSCEIKNTSQKAVKAKLEVFVLESKEKPKPNSSGEITINAGESRQVKVPYNISVLTLNWKVQNKMIVMLEVDDKPAKTEQFVFSTWPVEMCVLINKTYLVETENPAVTSINLGIADETLKEVAKISLDVINRGTNKKVLTASIDNVQDRLKNIKIPSASVDKYHWYLPMAGQLSLQNLILYELDVSSLPVRPYSEPERDYVLSVTALDKDGKAICSSKSDPFCITKDYQETLEPARTVDIDEKGHFLIVNGKPFFPLGMSHISANPYGGKTRQQSWGADRLTKMYGFNNGARWPSFPNATKQWQADNVYHAKANTGGPHGLHIAEGDIDTALKKADEGFIMAQSMDEKENYVKADVLNNHPSILTYGVMIAEGSPMFSHSDGYFVKLAEYVKKVKKITNRPISVMGSASVNWPFDVFPEIGDVIFSENEPAGPLRMPVAVKDKTDKKKKYVLGYLPQQYEYLPWERERFQTYENIIRGCRAWWGIQGIGDPSLYRGLNAELRYLMENALSSNEDPPQVKIEPEISYIVKKKGNKTTIISTNCAPVNGGRWQWVSKAFSGKLSHRGTSAHPYTPAKGGYYIHSSQDGKQMLIKDGDKLVQYVYIDPDAKPDCIMVAVPTNENWNNILYWGDFNHEKFKQEKIDEFWAGELYFFNSYNINCSWGGTPERKKELWDRFRFPKTAFKKMGNLPSAGDWVKLEIDLAKDVSAVNKIVNGIAFISHGAECLWDYTAITRGKQDIILIDDANGIEKEKLKNVTIEVPNIKDGTKVKVLFESRSLTVKDGKFTDDYSGVVDYDFFWEGWAGDGLTYGMSAKRELFPDFLALGYCYNNGPVGVHIYEIEQ